KLALPPMRSSALARGDLLRQLDEGLEGKLTLLSAPAGFGKTTLISEWAAALNARYGRPTVVWVSLDAGDNDPTRFWRYIVAACQTFDAEIGLTALTQLSAPRQPAFEAILTTLINDLSLLNSKRVLVLEDYHFVESQVIHDALTFLLDH